MAADTIAGSRCGADVVTGAAGQLVWLVWDGAAAAGLAGVAKGLLMLLQI